MLKKAIFLLILASFCFGENIVYLKKTDGYWKLQLTNTSNGLVPYQDYRLFPDNSGSFPISYITGDYLKIGDLNGDGKDDVVVTRSNWGSKSIGVYDLTKINTDESNVKIYNNVNFTSSNILLVEVGDFNDDSKDELMVIYQNDNYIAQKTYDVKSGNQISLEILVNTDPNSNYQSENETSIAYGNLVQTIKGDFKGLGYDQVGLIYTDIPNVHYVSKVFDLKTNSFSNYRELTSIADAATNLKSVSGDFNNDGKFEIGYSFKSTNNNQILRVYDHPNYSNKKYISTTSVGEIDHLLSGDFNFDGSDELCIVYDDASGYHNSQKVYNISGLSMSEIAYRNLTGYSDNAEMILATNGDYNCNSYDEIFYVYKKKSSSTHTIAAYQPTDLNSFRRFDLGHNVVDVASIGIITEYNAFSEDKTYGAIKENKTSNNNKFYLGWFTGHNWETVDLYGQLKSDSPTNTIMHYSFFENNDWEEFQVDFDRFGDFAKTSNTFSKQGLMQADFEGLVNNNNVISDQVKLNLETIDQSNDIIGYYTGDDVVGRINKGNGTWGQLQAIQNYMSANSNKYTFVADVYSNLEPVYTSGKTYFNIPMLEEYIYKTKDNTEERKKFKKMDIFQRITKMNHLVKNASHQPGFIYVSQAHGDKGHTDFPNEGIPNWEESRYDVFNSIIHGAAGLFYWDYYNTDRFNTTYNNGSTVRNNVAQSIRRINTEITNGNLSDTESLLEALENGHIEFDMFSNKDSFEADYNYTYKGYYSNQEATTSESEVKFGENVSDLNYIIRKAGNNYYLLTVNNSNSTINNITYFLPKDKVNGLNILEILIKYNGTRESNSMQKVAKKIRGKEYITFTENAIDPFEVKIYRIGTSTSFSKEIVENIEYRQNEEITSYNLSPNYPNPFNPTTKINYYIESNGYVTLKVYNSIGQEVTTLVDKNQMAGKYTVNFDGSNLASGIYYYTLRVNNFVETKKMILVK